MSLDWLTTAISDDAPTGPNLEATDDSAFIDFYFEAESQMPERYFTPGIKAKGAEFMPGTLFDKKSIDLKNDKPIILDLLKRSRDLRLLSLLARMSILAGDLQGFADAVDGTAAVLTAFPTDVHPTDMSDKRGALDDLGNAVVVCIPLQYAELAGTGEVSLRRYQVASGASEPREGEVGLSASKLNSELASPGNTKAVDAAHAALNRAAAALDRIKIAGLESDPPFNPAVDATVDTIREMQQLIASARPDLQPWAPSAHEPVEAVAEASAGDDDADAPASSGAAVAPVAQAAAPTIVTQIPSRAAALRTLKAIEVYFATHEPATPSLLLITQARLLVGMPLIEAIETLLPASAPKAVIDFGPATGFKLDMARLKMLSGEATAQAAAIPDEDPGDEPQVANRSDVAGHINALEQYFRAREPASPIPVLLAKARGYLEKDFAAIVAELLPPKAEEQSA